MMGVNVSARQKFDQCSSFALSCVCVCALSKLILKEHEVTCIYSWRCQESSVHPAGQDCHL